MEILTNSKMVYENGQWVKKSKYKYISFDNIAYDEMRACREHEFDIRFEECEKEIKNLSPRLGIVPFDGEYHNPDDSGYYWFCPENEEQIALLNETFQRMSQWNGESLSFDKSDIGKWVCIEDTYDRDFYMFSLEYQIRYVNEVLGRLGFQPVELKPKEE